MLVQGAQTPACTIPCGGRATRVTLGPKLMKASLLLTAALLATPVFAQPGLTIYNGRFAVVRDIVPLELKAGENSIRYSGATSNLDPTTVILRDPSGKVPLSILEQNYQNDPVNQLTLLDRFEGQAVSFLVRDSQKGDRILEGKVIRSGYVPGAAPVEPIIEVDGRILFELPGRPLFPMIKDEGVLLKPRLNWKIQSPEAATLQAELAYLTQGLEWNASYNLVLPETGDAADLNGWVTIKNMSGKQFDNARVKLMAGDIHRSQPDAAMRFLRKDKVLNAMSMTDSDSVSEKSFDDFHLYTLPRPTTLRDQETKQLEFTRAAAVPTRRIYTYDGQQALRFHGQTVTDDISPASQKTVASSLEFTNSEAAALGIPLPAGTIRVYRRDGEQLEFIGEDTIAHTPRNEKINLKVGNAFDLVGERKRTGFQVDVNKHTMDETFEIRLRNQGKAAAEIRTVERLWRAVNWTMSAKSQEFNSQDSHTVEFVSKVEAQGEAVLTYTVHYWW